MAKNENRALLDAIQNEQKNTSIPEFKTGDTVKVHLKITEGSKERIQMFEGFVLKRSGSVDNPTFTVRKESFGIGVEKTFFLHSPNVVKIDVLKLGKVRQSRIFYMRERKGKSARIKVRSNKG